MSCAPRSFREGHAHRASSVARPPDGTEHKVGVSTHDFTAALQLKRGSPWSERTTIEHAHTTHTLPRAAVVAARPRQPARTGRASSEAPRSPSCPSRTPRRACQLHRRHAPDAYDDELDKVSAAGFTGKRKLLAHPSLLCAGCGRPHAEPFRGHRLLELQSCHSATLQTSEVIEFPAYAAYRQHGSKVVARDGGTAVETTRVFRIDFGARDFTEVAALGVGAFLTLDKLAAQDTARPANPIVPIVDGSALAIGRLIPDTTRPQLINFTLDLDDGLLYLNFSEPVDPDAWNSTGAELRRARPRRTTMTLAAL